MIRGGVEGLNPHTCEIIAWVQWRFNLAPSLANSHKQICAQTLDQATLPHKRLR